MDTEWYTTSNARVSPAQIALPGNLKVTAGNTLRSKNGSVGFEWSGLWHGVRTACETVLAPLGGASSRGARRVYHPGEARSCGVGVAAVRRPCGLDRRWAPPSHRPPMPYQCLVERAGPTCGSVQWSSAAACADAGLDLLCRRSRLACALWHSASRGSGASDGPCVVLSGVRAGAICALLRGWWRFYVWWVLAVGRSRAGPGPLAPRPGRWLCVA